jgi:hypothetical protein
MGNKIGRKLSELELLEGGGGSGMMGGGGGGRASMSGIVDKNAKKNKTDFVDEMIAADKKLAMKRELETVTAKPERQQALKNATTNTSGGVKTTSYPYVGPNEYAKGGSVSSRADGIAQRGKTKGRMC